mmetsp:Transcript_55283/g.63503  ORF Transcript_55283/g.63503 Transcript_55283/m.63503 type:complete len:90 (-) Transcript_55283:50-319(-)
MSASQHLGHFLQRLPIGFRYAYALSPFYFIYQFRRREKQYYDENGYPSISAEATPVALILGYSVTPIRTSNGALCGYTEITATKKKTQW